MVALITAVPSMTGFRFLGAFVGRQIERRKACRLVWVAAHALSHSDELIAMLLKQLDSVGKNLRSSSVVCLVVECKNRRRVGGYLSIVASLALGGGKPVPILRVKVPDNDYHSNVKIEPSYSRENLLTVLAAGFGDCADIGIDRAISREWNGQSPNILTRLLIHTGDAYRLASRRGLPRWLRQSWPIYQKSLAYGPHTS